MKIRAFAKVNLGLDVVGERDDGYHELRMIMAPLALHDLIEIEKAGTTSLTTNNPRIPTDERNIMIKVANAVCAQYHLSGGVKMHLTKHIPSQAGLAGGSADGAAVIKAMNRLYGLHMSYEKMVEMTKNIGADIPFCIYSRMAEVGGIGEKFDFIDTKFQCHVLLVKPRKGVSTKKCFDMMDAEKDPHPDMSVLKQALENNDFDGVCDALGNSMEGPAITMVPDIQAIKDDMNALGFRGTLMSGSGSCVFGLTDDAVILEAGRRHFKGRYPFVRVTRFLDEK